MQPVTDHLNETTHVTAGEPFRIIVTFDLPTLSFEAQVNDEDRLMLLIGPQITQKLSHVNISGEATVNFVGFVPEGMFWLISVTCLT